MLFTSILSHEIIVPDQSERTNFPMKAEPSVRKFIEVVGRSEDLYHTFISMGAERAEITKAFNERRIISEVAMPSIVVKVLYEQFGGLPVPENPSGTQIALILLLRHIKTSPLFPDLSGPNMDIPFHKEDVDGWITFCDNF